MVAWGYALLILAPMVWILSNSFKRQIDILMGHAIAPVTLANYDSLLWSRQSHFLDNVLNSTIVAVVSTALVLADRDARRLHHRAARSAEMGHRRWFWAGR